LVAALLDGTHALALAHDRTTTTVRNSSVRPDKNLASLLGQCISARGTDPMRAFPFLAAEASSLAQLRELCAPLELPDGAQDPYSSIAKGRLVAWHEDLILVLDLSGFCAFSASALLADRLATLDDLARWIAPSSLQRGLDFDRAPARCLLAVGATLARAQRELNRRWGWKPEDDLPAWASERLSAPGMVAEYRAFRENPAAFLRAGDAPPAAIRARSAAAQRSGRVQLRAFGSLGEVLGSDCSLELALPAAAIEVLRATARAHPRAAKSLLRDEASLPAIYRGGARIEPEALVFDGETLDLLLVIGGG
jgi:hypothetical protein